MLTDLIQGLDGLLSLPASVRYLLWIEAAQTVLLLGIFLKLTAPNPPGKEKRP